MLCFRLNFDFLSCVSNSIHSCPTRLSHFEGSFKCGQHVRPFIPEKQRLRRMDPSLPSPSQESLCPGDEALWSRRARRHPMLEYHASLQQNGFKKQSVLFLFVQQQGDGPTTLFSNVRYSSQGKAKSFPCWMTKDTHTRN